MQKSNKRLNFALAAIIMFSMVAMYSFMPAVEAASLTDAKDTISDSDVGATSVTHTITFTSAETLAANEYYEVVIPNDFTGVAVGNVTCPHAASTTENVAGGGAADWSVTCTADEAIESGAKTLTITDTTNPSTGSYSIFIYTRDENDVELEKAEVRVYIIDAVRVSATVQASLTFAVGEVTPGETINGAVTTATSTASSTPFGNLTVGATSTVAQELSVGTNATDGYIVTVQQDHQLQSAAGAIIDGFSNGSTSPDVWVDPAGSLSDDTTWGHLAITTDDNIAAFAGEQFAGLMDATPLTVMSHTGVADGNTDDVGVNKVAYAVKITALQEAGDYTNTMTYICTPQF